MPRTKKQEDERTPLDPNDKKCVYRVLRIFGDRRWVEHTNMKNVVQPGTPLETAFGIVECLLETDVASDVAGLVIEPPTI